MPFLFRINEPNTLCLGTVALPVLLEKKKIRTDHSSEANWRSSLYKKGACAILDFSLSSVGTVSTLPIVHTVHDKYSSAAFLPGTITLPLV